MRSTWTKKVAAPVVALAAGALVAAGGAQAATPTLTVKQARSLAKKLEAKQRKERPLVFQQLGHAVRRSSQRIDFSYRDRSKSHVLCVAKIVVVQTGSNRAADMRDAKCHGIPSEVLLFEKASRSLAQSVRALRSNVRQSQKRYTSSLAECDKVVVPKNRRHDVDLLVKSGGVYAFYSPLRARLGDFATEIHDINAGDPELRKGVAAWENTLVLFDSLPAASADPCAAVREWSNHGFSADTAPADFDELTIELDSLKSQSRKLDRAAKHLDDAGVFPGPAAAFAPNGLLAIVLGKA